MSKGNNERSCVFHLCYHDKSSKVMLLNNKLVCFFMDSRCPGYQSSSTECYEMWKQDLISSIFSPAVGVVILGVAGPPLLRTWCDCVASCSSVSTCLPLLRDAAFTSNTYMYTQRERYIWSSLIATSTWNAWVEWGYRVFGLMVSLFTRATLGTPASKQLKFMKQNYLSCSKVQELAGQVSMHETLRGIKLRGEAFMMIIYSIIL